MRMFIPILAGLALAACTAGSPPPGTAPLQQSARSLSGPVSYDVSSWGRLLLRWQVNPDGSGEIWRGDAPGRGPGAVRKYRLTIGEPALQAFIAKVEPLRATTAGGIDCQFQISDMRYGSIVWDYPAGKQSYDFNAGCRSPAANAALEEILAVSDIVEKMATIEAEPYATEAPPVY